MLRTLGVLGGMGPLATASFMNQVIALSPAKSDQEHIPMFIRNIPQIPDRTKFLMGIEDENPFFELKKGFNELTSLGVSCIVIPCNTAHYWYDALTQNADVHAISIVQSVIKRAKATGKRKVGILATTATLNMRIYQTAFSEHNIEFIEPNEQQQALVMQGITAVKSGNLALGRTLLSQSYEQMLAQGADAVLFGCTEIPLVLNEQASKSPETCLNTIAILAQECVNWAYSLKQAEQLLSVA
ncbi:aspartate/glutamate racemase family protein [Pseudoalteromonas arctica]|uniref:Aspartate/glutamate racemase family protein n=1 Tax=Pseudoalteromonas arctica TaxID=394751 RepID=A0A7X9YFR9_9GAMM|nr:MULTISPECIES: amino acid racemase [Pseudoalteromonas]MBH0088807.1 aspartate/glutamate racemase family protein [Pseudoalteromonas sp. NSLLW218]NMF47967.1 aspartate/glutamate racemase family protein [Pseudoalteromonas arctica]